MALPRRSSIVSLLFIFLCLVHSVSAQIAPATVQCGQIIDGEFLKGGNEGLQAYNISLAPGDKLTVSGDTVGDYLRFTI